MQKPKASFTLIELLIVVLIIGILASIAIPNVKQAFTRAQIARVYSDFRHISSAIEQYTADHGAHMPYNTQGRYSLTYLTTPVAYMDSLDRVIDPFNDRYLDEEGVQIIDTELGSYLYLSFRGWYLEHFPKEDWGVRRNDKIVVDFFGDEKVNPTYFLRSIGPSRTSYLFLHVYNMQSFKFLEIYTPSNGLYSVGSLYAFDGSVISDL